MNPQNNPKPIIEQLCQFARANLVVGGREFDEHSPLAEAGIDSFSLVELLVYSERAFGISVPEALLTHTNLQTLSALGCCIAELAERRTAIGEGFVG